MVTDQQPKDCVVQDDILQPCPGLDKAISRDYGRGLKGITWLRLVKFPDGEPMQVSKTGAVLYSGNLPATGVIMNYCPFCGASIGHHFKVKDDGDSTNSAS